MYHIIYNISFWEDYVYNLKGRIVFVGLALFRGEAGAETKIAHEPSIIYNLFYKHKFIL